MPAPTLRPARALLFAAAAVAVWIGGEAEVTVADDRSLDDLRTAGHATVDPSAPLADDIAPPLSVENTFRAWMDDATSATVRVETPGVHGSGALASARHVLTAAHVVAEARRASIVLPDGHTAVGRVLRVDVARDLALIELPQAQARCVQVAASPPAPGAWVVSAGILGGVEHELAATASIGVVLGGPESALLLQSGIGRGMSGGPVLSARGELVGVLTHVNRAARLGASDAFLGGAHCDEVPTARALEGITYDEASWNTTRDRAFRAVSGNTGVGTSPLASSVVELRHDSVYTRGLVVGTGLVLTSVDASVAREGSCERVHLSERPTVVCVKQRAAGELMLLQFATDALTPLRSRERAVLERGVVMMTADARSLGVVDATGLLPGLLAPFIEPLTRGHCGTLWNMRRMQNPNVVLGRVLAHDVDAVRGELLVDAHGRPAAIHVGEHVARRGYAVPIDDALARFGL